MAKEIFKRYELKFVITNDTYSQLLKTLSPYLTVDTNGNKEGCYTISSIYYDTVNNLFHQERMLGQSFRQKLRMRVYNKVSVNDWAYLEIKQKHKKVVNKRRTLIKLKDAYNFLEQEKPLGNSFPFEVSNHQILKEIDFFKNLYQLEPRVIVSYERQAFEAIEDNSIRVTFDKDLRKRNYDFRLENGSYGESYMKSSLYVLEVKLMNRMPLWLTRILSDYQCVLQPFSKYSNSYYNIDMALREKKIV